MRLLVIALLACGLVTACSKEKKSETPDTAVDPAALLQRAAAAVTQAKTFHFKLTHENGSTPLPLGLQLVSAEGDFEVPGKLAADVRGKGPGGINISTRIIAIDDRAWYTNLFTRNWDRIPGASLRDLADPGTLAVAMLPRVRDPTVGDGGQVDGARTLKIEGTVDSGELRDALGFARAGHSVKVEAWIGAEDSLPRRIKLTGRLVSDEAEDVVRQIELSRFGAPVQINPP